MERDILVEVNHPFIVKLHYGKRGNSHFHNKQEIIYNRIDYIPRSGSVTVKLLTCIFIVATALLA